MSRVSATWRRGKVKRVRPSGSTRGPWASKAFSLVEVVLSLGIISFALLSMMALMPTGLSTLRKAMDDAMESQILRTITADALTTSFTNLSAQFSDKSFYFDEEGAYLAGSPSAAPVATRYWVKTTLANPVYPGSSNATVSSNLSIINIQIVSGTGVANRTTSIYNVAVPNSGN